MKFSIITATFNNAKTIRDCIDSVNNQVYTNIEHIIVDGKSSDETVEIIESIQPDARLISEPDNGMYHALNKGLLLATGDIVGFLHADDVFYDANVLAGIAMFFDNNPSADAVYGDIIFVNERGKTTRYYSSAKWKLSSMANGIMPAHPSFFARKRVYDKYPFNEKYKIAADFDQVLRVAIDKQYQMEYIPMITTKMRKGGKSTKNFMSNIVINREVLQSCLSNGLKTNYFKIYAKYPSRLLELFRSHEA